MIVIFYLCPYCHDWFNRCKSRESFVPGNPSAAWWSIFVGPPPVFLGEVSYLLIKSRCFLVKSRFC